MSDADAAQRTGDSPLAVICGGGTLPFAVADAVGKRGRRVVLFAIRGWADPQRVAAYSHHWASFGQFGWFCRVAQREGCRDVVLIGSVVRPAIWKIRPDFKTLRLLPRIVGLLRGGDDRLLKGVAAIFEEHGFRLVGAHEIAPDILMPEGPLGRERPKARDHADIATALALLDATSPFDVGQAVVVADARVLAIEAAEGTDRMLARIAELRQSGRIAAATGHGVLVKAAKRGQDRRVDLPSIGPRTVEGAARAGLAGIAVVAGSTIIAEPEAYRCGRRPRAIVRDRCARRDGYVMTASAQPGPPAETVDVFLVAGEESGDRLGAALMRALRERTFGHVSFAGVGGREMAAEGVTSLYSIDDLPIIGFSAIPRRIPKILRLMRFTAKAVVAKRPHVLVVIDSPGFTRGIARRVRAADPTIAIVEYVSPSVWAWRPGRARVMRAYIDHILALLPFEPEVHRRLGGPPCTYVGHPLAGEVRELRPNAQEALRRLAAPPVLLVLPGSRVGEVERLLGVFADTVALLRERAGPLEVVVPTVPHLAEPIRAATKQWPMQPRIVVETAEKQAAFRIARAALAKSGTVTLELAVAGVPTVGAYRVSWLEAVVGRRLVKVSSVILANLVLAENVVPEFIQEACTSENLAAAVLPLLTDTPQRRRQIEAFSRLDAIMEIGSKAPATRAADIVLDAARRAMPSR